MAQYAGLWVRVKAFAADYVIISAYIILLMAVTLVVQSASPGFIQLLFSTPWSGQITGFLVMTLPVTFYFVLCESSTYQATWGKYWQGLRVIEKNGKRLSTTRALGRTATKFIPWELAHICIWHIYLGPQNPSPIIITGLILVWVLVGVYIITLLSSGKKQSLYDLLTNTYVVKNQPDV